MTTKMDNTVSVNEFDGHDLESSRGMEVDIRSLFMLLWRRKMMILGTILIGLSLAAIALSLVTPRYSAKALVLVETSNAQSYPKELEAIFGKAKYDTSVILNEIEIIRSRNLARKIVLEHNLLADPELNPKFKDFQGQRTARGSAFKNVNVSTLEMDAEGQNLIRDDLEIVVSKFLNNLVVRSVPGSHAIYVEYLSRFPDHAAFVSNAVVDGYVQQRLEDKFSATQKLAVWLDKRLTDLRAQVRNAEEAVVSYKNKHGILQGTRNIVSAEQLSDINQQLVDAKGQKAAAEATLQQIQHLSNNVSKIETIPEIFNSETIRRLKLLEGEQSARLSELSIRYGPKHPSIVKVTSELSSTRKQIRGEILQTSESLKKGLDLATARVEALEGGLKEASGENFEDADAMVGLRALQREADSTRLIFDTFLATYKRSDDQDELQDPEARVISYAVVPHKPSYPNTLLILSLSSAVSLFFGLALALLIEKLDNTYRSASQLEQAFGIPCYGLIPLVEGKLSQKAVANYVVSKPSSIITESVKTLRTVLKLRNKGEKTKVLTITSSFPGEGKTTLSIWMARLAAKSGEKVILIDGDLRRPNVHRSLGMSNDVSLVDYLTGQKELDETIKRDESTGLDVIMGASVPNSALDLVSSDKMHKLVEGLKQSYDLVIIDTLACLAVSDAHVLTTLSDFTLYAVGWDQTPREVVMSGIKQFADTREGQMAFVLSNVDVTLHSKYGYGDSVYYYGRHKEYYNSSS